MSALPVAFPEISGPEISAAQTHRSVRPDARSRGITGATSAAGNWKLTDRGIAVVMLIAAVIFTAALAVIGITAMEVTSADYDTGLHDLQRVDR